MQPDDWEDHRAKVERAKRDRIRNRYKYGARKKMEKRALCLSNFLRRYKYTIKELRSELSRQVMHAHQNKMSPEAQRERQEIVQARRALRITLCDHSKLAPRLRKSGPHAGEWCCPTCNKPVSAPVGGLEIVK